MVPSIATLLREFIDGARSWAAKAVMLGVDALDLLIERI